MNNMNLGNVASEEEKAQNEPKSFSGMMNNLSLGTKASEQGEAQLEPLNKSLSWKMPKQPHTNEQKAFM